MAQALRVFYPFARVPGDVESKALDCSNRAKGDKPTIAKCAAALDELIAATIAELPKNEGLSGCALVVADAVRGALSAAQKESGKDPAQRLGVRFGDMHDGMRPCAAKLFRLGTPSSPARPTDVATQLGLRDDALPGPASYAKPREGHLWTATGREVDRETLKLR